MGFSDSNVISTIQKEKAPTQRQDVLDILRADFKREGKEELGDQYYNYLVSATETPQHRVLRSGNSILHIEILSPGVCKIDFFHNETPREIVKDAQEYMRALKKAGYKKVILEAEQQKVGKLAKIAADAVNGTYVISQLPDNDYKIEWSI